jgi:hypothetical protein
MVFTRDHFQRQLTHFSTVTRWKRGQKLKIYYHSRSVYLSLNVFDNVTRVRILLSLLKLKPAINHEIVVIKSRKRIRQLNTCYV